MEEFFNRLATIVLALSIWYGIFVFITMEPNPLYWGTFAKVLSVIFTAIVISKNFED